MTKMTWTTVDWKTPEELAAAEMTTPAASTEPAKQVFRFKEMATTGERFEMQIEATSYRVASIKYCRERNKKFQGDLVWQKVR